MHEGGGGGAGEMPRTRRLQRRPVEADWAHDKESTTSCAIRPLSTGSPEGGGKWAHQAGKHWLDRIGQGGHQPLGWSLLLPPGCCQGEP